MRIFVALLVLFHVAGSAAFSQDMIKEYPISLLDKDATENKLYQSLLAATQAWDDSLGGISHYYADMQGEQIGLFIFHDPSDPDADWTEPSYGKLIIVTEGASAANFQYASKHILIDAFPTRLNWERSSLFYANGVLYLKLFYFAHNDFVNRGGVSFFTAQGDSLLSLGDISIFDDDDPSGIMESEFYGGELLPFESSPDGVRITLMREYYSKYKIEYLLTPNKLELIQDHKPAFHLSTEEAEKELKDIFAAYYSDKWKLEAETDEGKRYRAESFLWQFRDLAIKRSDFAPAFYNKACMLALLDRHTPAIEALTQAISLDPGYKEKALSDPDLTSLREIPAFQGLVK